MGNATQAMRVAAEERWRPLTVNCTDAANAGSTSKMNVSGTVEIDWIRWDQRASGGNAHMTSAAVADDTGFWTPISAASTAPASGYLDDAGKTVRSDYETPHRLYDGATIDVDYQGSGTTAHDMDLTVEWRPITKGATVSAA